jgi:hypothetical protein
VLLASEQNIRDQQNLTRRKLRRVALGSNIWPVVRKPGRAIAATIDAAMAGSYHFIEMPLPPKSRTRST